jgi:hypothetical protein
MIRGAARVAGFDTTRDAITATVLIMLENPGVRERILADPARAIPRLLPWAVGFVTYQLINPGYVSWWASAWTSFGHDIGFTPASWMSASILSFAVAAVVTLAVGLLHRWRRA